MGLGQYMLYTVSLDLWQLCEIDEKQYNMRPLTFKEQSVTYISFKGISER